MMVLIDSALDVQELVALALSIRDDGMTWHDAFALACQELPSIQADITSDARWVPSRVVLFDGDGQPRRVPNLLTARELMDWTGRE